MNINKECALSSKINEHIFNKKNIIWDWNGTIINDVEYVVKIVNSILEDEKLNKISLAEYREKFCFPVISFYKSVGINFKEKTFSQYCDTFMSRYLKGLSDCSPFSYIKNIIENLHQSNKLQIILSASDQNNLEDMVSDFGINKYITTLYGLDDLEANSKIDRGRQLVSDLNLNTEKSIIIGDTLHDLEVGKALGIDVLLLSHGHQSYERLKHYKNSIEI